MLRVIQINMNDLKIAEEKGFSLIEILLVLFITFFVISIGMKMSFGHIAAFNDEQIQFQSQLKIREAQFLAYANNEDFYITSRDGKFSIAQSTPTNIYFEQKLPPNVQLRFTRGEDKLSTFVIQSTMNTNGILRLHVETQRGNQQYTLNIGKGRFTYVQ